jgi:hypothetical protein
MNAKTADESQKATLRLNQKPNQGRFLKKKNTTTKKKSTGPASVAVSKKQREQKAVSTQSIQVVDMVSNGIKSSASSVRLDEERADGRDRSASNTSDQIIQEERAALEIQKRWRGLKARRRLRAVARRTEDSAAKALKTNSSHRIIPRIPAIKVLNQSDLEPPEPRDQSPGLTRHPGRADLDPGQAREEQAKQSGRGPGVTSPPDSLMSSLG